MSDVALDCILAQARAARAQLERALAEIDQAVVAAEAGNRNGAAGSLMLAEPAVDSALVLVRASLALHRAARP